MAKRFFNTARIEEDWYINLSCKHRELLRYCESKCDGAGIFSWNSKIASTYIGEKVTDEDLTKIPVSKLPTGKFFVHGFCFFQNGKLSKNSPAHNSVFKSLAENEITESDLFSTLPNRVDSTHKEEEREEVQERGKEGEGEIVLPFDSENFLAAWKMLRESKKWKNKSQNALQISLKKLAAHDEPTAIQMMEDAIAGEWQGLVEPKKKNGTTKDNSVPIWRQG